MNKNQKEFEELLEEYRKLRASTHIEAQIIKKGEPYKVYNLKPDELMRRKEIAKDLVENYKDFFKESSEEWFDIQSDAN